MYADITLETFLLDTPNNIAVVTDAPAKCTLTIYPLSKLDKSTIFPVFHTDCQLSLSASTQSLMHCMSTTTSRKRNLVLLTEVFSMEPAQTNSVPQFLSVSIILSTPLHEEKHTLVYFQ
jgi:hypothetical protein